MTEDIRFSATAESPEQGNSRSSSALTTPGSSRIEPAADERSTADDGVPFPATSIEDESILERMDRGSGTANFLWSIASMFCGANDLAGLRARLDQVQVQVRNSMESGEYDRIAARAGLRPDSDCLEPGLTYFYLTVHDRSGPFPMRQLYASLALWLLAESHKRMDSSALEAKALETQASLCVAFALGQETAIGSANYQIEKSQRKRAQQASRAGSARHDSGNRRKKELLSDFEQGAWNSVPKAAEALAKKHSFSFETVLRWLREARRGRHSPDSTKGNRM